MELLLEDGQNLVDQRHAAGHPLEVGPPAVVVRTVEAAVREALGQPAQERLVPDMHAECDLGLLTVTTKRALTDQQSDHHAAFEGRQLSHRLVLPSAVAVSLGNQL